MVVLALWAAVNWIASIRLITDLYVVIPTWDYWRVPQHLAQILSWNPRFLWSQHNEHRPVFPDLVFTVDVLLFHGRRVFPLVVSFLCYAASAAVIAYAIAQEADVSREIRAATILLVLIETGWKGCVLVLADPFLLQWTLMEVAVLLSLALLTLAPKSSNGWPLAGAISAAVLATYSSGNGLLLWPVLMAAGFLLRLTKRQMGALALSASVAVGLYFAGYHFSERTHFGDLILHPVYAACFLAAYLSMPFGGMKSPQFGTYVGIVNLATALILFSDAARRGTLATRPGIVLFGSYLFTVLSALLIAAGRMDITDPALTGAKAERYLAPVMINWGVFIALLLWTAALRRWSTTSLLLLTAVIAGLMVVSFPKLGWWLQTGERGFINAQITELSIENGLQDPKLLRLIFPDPGFVTEYLPGLRDAHLSIFYGDPGKWLGEPATRFASPIPSQTDGAVTRIFPRNSGFEVVGWARDRRMPQFSRVLLVNATGKIIGFGRRIPAGLPTELLSLGMPRQFAWVGFVPSRYAVGPFSVQIVSRTGRESQPVRGLYHFPGTAPR